MTKKIVLIVAVLAMLIGGSFSGMQVMEIGPFSKEEAAPAVEKPAKVKEEDAPTFVDMEPLMIPVIQGNRVAATVQIQLKLEASEENAAAVRKSLRRLQDAFIRDLNSYIPRLLRADSEIDVDKIKSRLYILSERTIGKGMVDNVLIQSIIDRPN